MIKKALVVALACAGIAFGGLAEAGRDDHNHGKHARHGHYDKHERNWKGGDKHRGPNAHYRNGYRDGYRDGPRVVYRNWTPPPRAWARGDRLPHYSRGGYYVVNDWHSHRLHRPNPGYQWVRVGPEYLLVAVATGVIASIILSN